MKRSEKEILRDILDCYCGLSPENLWCDGEATRAQAQNTSRFLHSKLKNLFKELGREVSETESYQTAGKNGI